LAISRHRSTPTRKATCKTHPGIVICHAPRAKLRRLIIESVASLDLTLARWVGTKSLFLRFGADLAFLHSVLL
jgi:hypothetical protein